MKKITITVLLAYVTTATFAQNIGIGSTDPTQKLQVNGNLLVTTPSVSPTLAPTPVQTKTMVNGNGNAVGFSTLDSTGRLYDPGGPSGNYLAGLNADAYIQGTPSNSVGIEITIESIGLGTGDSLFIKQSSGSTTNLLAVGNGYNTPGKYVYEGGLLYFIFKSNGDASTGIGFSILFRRIYVNVSTLPDVTNAIGNTMFFNTRTGAFRAGFVNNKSVGTYSAALGEFCEANSHSFAAGYNTKASGGYAVAMGIGTRAEAYGSVALGNGANATDLGAVAFGTVTLASANSAIAFGSQTEASGGSSTAGGFLSVASGGSSVAIGSQVTASANYAVAMGKESVASGLASISLGQLTQAVGDYSLSTGYNSRASGDYATAMGYDTKASATNCFSLGRGTTAQGYAGTVVGMYNYFELFSGQTSPSATTQLFVIGNGDDINTRHNAMVALKNGNIGIGEDHPSANLHIKHAAGGGIILENENDGNKWRIYSASGDNNLTFYNNAGTEIADIDDVTGTFSALSDGRYKKDIRNVSPLLKMVMQLQPKLYHFNWQEQQDELQLGFIAQEAHKLFPQLVSYDKEKDLFKMNYAGFSTVAIKAIQEQQLIIEDQNKKIESLEARLKKLESILSR